VTPAHLIRRHNRLESKTGHVAVPYRLHTCGVFSIDENRRVHGRHARAPGRNG
jgi:hypothetical protein